MVSGVYLENDFKNRQQEAAFKDIIREKIEHFYNDMGSFNQAMNRIMTDGHGVFSGEGHLGSLKDCQYHKAKIAKLIAECNDLSE